jgi:hypothetical protein
VFSYFIRRILLIIPTFIGITSATFLIMQMVPGGPVERAILQYKMAMISEGGVGGGDSNLSREISQDAIDEMRKFYGFDKPVHVRYVMWLANVVRLDLGEHGVEERHLGRVHALGLVGGRAGAGRRLKLRRGRSVRDRPRPSDCRRASRWRRRPWPRTAP